MFYIDPVCKKRLRKKQEYAIIKHNGKVYHLCCKVCKELFIMSAQSYIPKKQEKG
ncbi:MAG: YHS domain-containing protein [Candidatus Nealsonbacteria bacterium]